MPSTILNPGLLGIRVPTVFFFQNSLRVDVKAVLMITYSNPKEQVKFGTADRSLGTEMKYTIYVMDGIKMDNDH